MESDIDLALGYAERTLRKAKLVRKGDILASVAGTPFGSSGSINLLKLSRVR